MRIHELAKETLVSVHLAARTKKEVLGEILDRLVEQKLPVDKRTVLDVLLERERAGSTGIGKGVAVPHARIATLSENILFVGVSRDGVDFSSLDNHPVNIFFLLLSPLDDFGPSLKTLADIARAINDTAFREHLLNAVSDRDLYALLKYKKDAVEVM